MRDAADAIVIGAGISGLTVAYGLTKRGHAVTILEAQARAGGVIGTRHRDGGLFELGPNSTLDTTPRIAELLRDLNLAGQRVAANPVAATRFIVRGGKLVALPASPGAFFTTSAFTLGAKVRLLREPFVAPGPADVDESIAAFVRRRLGSEFLDYAIDPFVAGVYAGDPERMSVAAAFPRLHALEQGYGSLIRGLLMGARKRRRSGEVAANAATSFSFRHGMQTLTDALANALAPIGHDVTVHRVTRDLDGAFVIEGLRRGEPFMRSARAVVLCAPARATAAMVGNVAADAAAALTGIEYSPITVVASAYRRGDVAHSLAGFGFLVPTKERRAILGCLFSSSMFDGRAPDGTVLLTAFAGGRRNPEIASVPDATVAGIAHEELAALVGAAQRPLWQEVVRWPQAIPQYDLGHLARLRRIDAAEAAVPGLYFCANYRGGVAVGDRVKCGDAMAAQVDAFLRA
jgi:oxygen-dependent protoporphyrinogen oxidase